jgi:hypothetical protein
VPQHRRGDGMAKQVRGPSAWACHLRALECPVDNHGDTTVGAERAKRCTTANEDHVSIGRRTAICEIRDQRPSNLLSKRQSSLTPSLSTDVKPRALPVDVASSKLHDVAGPETQAGEQQQNRSIALADG